MIFTLHAQTQQTVTAQTCEWFLQTNDTSAFLIMLRTYLYTICMSCCLKKGAVYKEPCCGRLSSSVATLCWVCGIPLTQGSVCERVGVLLTVRLPWSFSWVWESMCWVINHHTSSTALMRMCRLAGDCIRWWATERLNMQLGRNTVRGVGVAIIF